MCHGGAKYPEISWILQKFWTNSVFGIQVSLDSSSSTPPFHTNEPPTEIEWSPARISNMDTVMQKTLVHPDFAQRQAMSFDEGDDGSSSSSRRNSASEKARQNLLAQRRQSQIQVSFYSSSRVLIGYVTASGPHEFAKGKNQRLRFSWRPMVKSCFERGKSALFSRLSL
ncbi:hypothetical protein ANCCAN_06732 [Ancylostoma caninum]|uniref:Uncharacterized protein n=1 Tax=Ancylostoma caninum TaxID=29170 RepID=A0A368GVX4_ANCCA|nr:hypothetical protein ANCCAN_06732 [Ancylostoma caninum]